jgi:hypothetical protein
MDSSSEATEQIVRISLMGVDYVLKLAGEGTERLTKLLVAFTQQEGNAGGKVRLASLLRKNKPLSIFEIKQGDLKAFAHEAKKYHLKYTAIYNPKGGPNSIVDLIITRDDESRLSRIIEKFGFAILDTDAVIDTIEREREERAATPEVQPEAGAGADERSEAERMADDFFSDSTRLEAEDLADPIQAQTQRSHPSEPTSTAHETSDGASARELDEKDPLWDRPSIRETIAEDKAYRASQEPLKPKAPPEQTRHEQPTPGGKTSRTPKPPAPKMPALKPPTVKER